MKRILAALVVLLGVVVFVVSLPNVAEGDNAPRPTRAPLARAPKAAFDPSCALCHRAHTDGSEHLVVRPKTPLPLPDPEATPPHFVHSGESGSCQSCHAVADADPTFDRTFDHDGMIHRNDVPPGVVVTVTLTVKIQRDAPALLISDHYPMQFQLVDAGGGQPAGGHGGKKHLNFEFGAANAGQSFSLTYTLRTPDQDTPPDKPYEFCSGVTYGDGNAVESPPWTVAVAGATPTPAPTLTATPTVTGTITETVTPGATGTTTATVTTTETVTPAATETPTAMETETETSTPTVMETPTPTPSTDTPTPTATHFHPTETGTPHSHPTATPTAIGTDQSEPTATQMPTDTAAPTESPTALPSLTPLPPTNTPVSTATPVPPADTPTVGPTATPTHSHQHTPTPTPTP